MSDMLTMKNRPTFVFKVKEAFLGSEKDKNITISTGFGFGDCGYPFETGETYLVYAYGYEETNAFSTSICTRTRPLGPVTNEDLTFLRGLPSAQDGATITGTISRYLRSSLEKDPIEPAPDLSLRIEKVDGEKKTYSVKTDANGNYSVAGLLTGNYRVIPVLSEGLEVSDYFIKEFYLNNKGCVLNKDARIENDSLVTGKVIDANGDPVKSAWVEVLPAGLKRKPKFNSNPEEFGVTGPEGGFGLYNLPPGKYTLSVNYTEMPDAEHPFPASFYPDAAQISRAQAIEISIGTKLKGLVIKTQPNFALQEVRGRTVWPDGSPAAEIYVLLKDPVTEQIVSRSETDKNGYFSLKGFSGKTYFVDAGKYIETPTAEYESSGKSRTFILDGKKQFFQIIMKKKLVKQL